MATTTIPSIAVRRNLAAANEYLARREHLLRARRDVEDVHFYLSLLRAHAEDTAPANKTVAKIERLLESIDVALQAGLTQGRWS